MQNFNQDLLRSEWCEEALAMKLRTAYSVQRMQHDLFPYDLIFGKPGTYHGLNRVELKSLNWKQLDYPNGLLEVYKDDNKALRPQWYEYNDKIDYVALQNIANFKVYIFDAQKLLAHFKELERTNEHMYAAHASSNHRNACPGFTYKIGWENRTAGHTGTIIDITDTMLHYALSHPEIKQTFPEIFRSLKAKYTSMMNYKYKNTASVEHNRLCKLYSTAA